MFLQQVYTYDLSTLTYVLTTYIEKFHSEYFQKVCSTSVVTEHTRSCHISVSLSSRRMKAYSSPKRNYRTKQFTI